MFERNKIDSPSSREALPCEIDLDDGRKLIAAVFVSASRTIGEELNAAGGFIEVEAQDSQRTFLPKQSIRAAKPIRVPRPESLERRVRQGDAFDPYTTLGIARSADREAIKRAYHTLAKAYHPDRLTALGVPQEIVDYATAMSKRINAAYSALQTASSLAAGPAAGQPAPTGAGTARAAAPPVSPSPAMRRESFARSGG